MDFPAVLRRRSHEPHGAVLVDNVGLLDVLDDDSLTSRDDLSYDIMGIRGKRPMAADG